MTQIILLLIYRVKINNTRLSEIYILKNIHVYIQQVIIQI